MSYRLQDKVWKVIHNQNQKVSRKQWFCTNWSYRWLNTRQTTEVRSTENQPNLTLHSVVFTLSGLGRCSLFLSVADTALASATVVTETGTLTLNYFPERGKSLFCDLTLDAAVAGQDTALSQYRNEISKAKASS